MTTDFMVQKEECSFKKQTDVMQYNRVQHDSQHDQFCNTRGTS